MNWIMVIAGALVGAPLRYLTDRAIQTRFGTAFPWGTFTVNLVASAVLGLLAGAATAVAVPASLQHLIGIGLCGTLSTYSTFSYETVRLTEAGAKFFAAANVVVSIVAGLGAAYAGTALAMAVFA